MFRLVLLIYNLLLPVVLILLLPAIILKARRRGGTWSGMAQRFGIFNESLRTGLAYPAGEGPLWLHAVSVGEAQVAVRLARALQAAKPGIPLVLTTATPTGQSVAREGLASLENASVIYAPHDLPFCVSRFLSLIRPSHYVVLESELWPNLLRSMEKRGIPVTLANARLSPRSEHRYKSLRFLLRDLFQIPSRILTSSPEDSARWQSLGIPPEKLHVTGNIKFDQSSEIGSEDQICQLRRILRESPLASRHPLLLAASTHPGEEGLIAETCRSLQPIFPHLGAIIVPRHAERSPTVYGELQAVGFPVFLRSRHPSPEKAPGPSPSPPILLVDTTGELASWHHLADVVVVGKSFLAHGGQNPAEAVLAGKPVVFGPNMENFQALVDILLTARAACQVPDAAGLRETMGWLLANPDDGRQMASRGQEALAPHEGAARKTALLILGGPGPLPASSTSPSPSP